MCDSQSSGRGGGGLDEPSAGGGGGGLADFLKLPSLMFSAELGTGVTGVRGGREGTGSGSSGTTSCVRAGDLMGVSKGVTGVLGVERGGLLGGLVLTSGRPFLGLVLGIMLSLRFTGRVGGCSSNELDRRFSGNSGGSSFSTKDELLILTESSILSHEP